MTLVWWLFAGTSGLVAGLFIARIARDYALNLLSTEIEVTAMRIPTLWVGILNGVLSLAVVFTLGPSIWGLFALIFTWSLVLLFLMDLKTWLLPDLITLPLIWCGLILHDLHVGPVSLHDALWGAVVGYSLLWLLEQGYHLFTKRQGMGHGDFKLLAALGAWLGWQALPFIVLTASVMGLLVGVALMWQRRATLTMAIPFGPFLAIAGIIALLKQGH